MAKFESYLKDGKGLTTTVNLCMFWGLVGTIIACFATVIAWIFAKSEVNIFIPIVDALPGTIGALIYILVAGKQKLDNTKIDFQDGKLSAESNNIVYTPVIQESDKGNQ